MNKYKYLTFIALTFWIFLWAFFAYGLFALTNSNASWILMFFVVISIINLGWWVALFNKDEPIDLFIKILFLVTLNLPAYFLSQKAFPKEKDDTNYELLADWEKEIINKKLKTKKSKEKLIQNDNELELSEKITRNYTKFVLYNILKDNPKLTETFEITKKVNNVFKNKKLNNEMINSYVSNLKKWNTFSEEDKKILIKNKGFAKNLLLNTIPQMLSVIYKQDRVHITIEVKVMLENKK